MDKKAKRPNVDSTRVYRIVWQDAVADCGWEETATAETHKCITVGYVVDENKEAICIASTISIDHNNTRMHIPKKWITKKEVIYFENQQQEEQGKNVTTVGEGSDSIEITFTD